MIRGNSRFAKPCSTTSWGPGRKRKSHSTSQRPIGRSGCGDQRRLAAILLAEFDGDKAPTVTEGDGDRCRSGRGVGGRVDNVWCGVPLRRSADACQGERDVLKSV